MAQDHIPGLGPRTEAPRLNPKADFAAVRLSPQEGFVLSRVDGHTSVAEICLISGLGEAATILVLQKLKAALIIVTSAPMNELPAGIAPPSASRQVSQTRPTTPGPPVAAVRAGTGAGSDPVARGPAVTPATSTPVAARPVPLLADAALDPAILADGADLSAAAKRRILSYHRQLPQLDLFARLEVEPSAERQEIRRAYFRLSKEFHPDRFYGKNVGPYMTLLGDLFKAISQAFATLSDDDERAIYLALLADQAADAPPPTGPKPSRFVAADTVPEYHPPGRRRPGSDD